MNNNLIMILISLFLISCSETDKMTNLENRISNIENQNKILTDSLNSVNTDFLKPFKIYEKIVLSELRNSPDKIISDYEILIKNYPNSFWKHEAKKRIENVKSRSKYWSEKEGWKLPGVSEISELIKIEDLISTSCPGC